MAGSVLDFWGERGSVDGGDRGTLCGGSDAVIDEGTTGATEPGDGFGTGIGVGVFGRGDRVGSDDGSEGVVAAANDGVRVVDFYGG